MQSFLYINNSIEFEESESTAKNALISACVLELNKVSQQNTEYQISEGLRIANSLVGRPVYYGIDALGKHAKNLVVGVVEKAWKVGNKIKSQIRITDLDLIEKLRQGVTYLFSIGGIADFAESVKRGGRLVKKFVNCVLTHLQILPLGVKVGFKNAKLERVLEINESVLLIDETGLTSDELILLHFNLSMF